MHERLAVHVTSGWNGWLFLTWIQHLKRSFCKILCEFYQFCAAYSWKTWRISSTTGHENKLFLLISLWTLSTSTSQPTHSWWYVRSWDCLAPNQGFMNLVLCWQKAEITGVWTPFALLDKAKGKLVLQHSGPLFLNPTSSQNGAARQRSLICHSIKVTSLCKPLF